MKIVIDGNIGAGKTTQLNLLESKGFKVHREPIEKWPLELFPQEVGSHLSIDYLRNFGTQGWYTRKMSSILKGCFLEGSTQDPRRGSRV
jgi:hypothetical protein